MNYQIIKDADKLKEFIEWLPEEQENEQFYVTLFSRKKYCSELKSDKAQLKRFTSKKKYLFNKISQLEIPLGYYKQDDLEIPQEALALYITPNPRNLEKATRNALKKFADVVTEEYNGYNPHQLVMSEIQTACGKVHFIDFEFDISKEDINFKLQEIGNIIPTDSYSIVKTRGGFHLLVRPDKAVSLTVNKNWHGQLSKLANVDKTGDLLLPVVGCSQGDFVPELIR